MVCGLTGLCWSTLVRSGLYCFVRVFFYPSLHICLNTKMEIFCGKEEGLNSCCLFFLLLSEWFNHAAPSWDCVCVCVCVCFTGWAGTHWPYAPGGLFCCHDSLTSSWHHRTQKHRQTHTVIQMDRRAVFSTNSTSLPLHSDLNLY